MEPLLARDRALKSFLGNLSMCLLAITFVPMLTALSVLGLLS